MKKLFLILAVLFTVNSVNAQNTTKYFDIKNNENLSIGAGLSVIPGKMYNVYGYTMNISLFGVYFDCILYSSLSTGASSSLSVNPHMPEGKVFVWHIGYKAPITDLIYIYPLIGHAKISTGYCDGSNYTISNSGHINNYYYEEEVLLDDIDFGGGIDLVLYNSPIIKFMVNGTFTRYSRYVGLSIVCNF